MLVFFFYRWFDGNETASCTPVSHSCHWLTRNTGWWANAWNSYSERRSKKTFRFSLSMFRDILNRIGPFLARETMTEDPISPELGLVLWLYPLGHCHNLYTIAEIAGLGVSTVFLLSSKTGLTMCYRTACFPAPLQFHFSWRQNRVCRSVPGTSNKYIFVFLRQEEKDCSSFPVIFVM